MLKSRLVPGQYVRFNQTSSNPRTQLHPSSLAFAVSLLAAAIILSFTAIEFFDYRQINVDTSIVVDKSRGEKLTVKMNVTFPTVPCYRE